METAVSRLSEYRQRVVEEHGEEHDYQYRHGLKKEEIVEMATERCSIMEASFGNNDDGIC